MNGTFRKVASLCNSERQYRFNQDFTLKCKYSIHNMDIMHVYATGKNELFGHTPN